MTESTEGKPPRSEQEPKLRATFSLMDFRAGHWPGTKTPPWWLNEMWQSDNRHWREAVKKMTWEAGNELLVGSGVIRTDTKTHEVDMYARRDPRHGKDYFGFVAYPKGKSFSDFWNEDETAKDKEEK